MIARPTPSFSSSIPLPPPGSSSASHKRRLDKAKPQSSMREEEEEDSTPRPKRAFIHPHPILSTTSSSVAIINAPPMNTARRTLAANKGHMGMKVLTDALSVQAAISALKSKAHDLETGLILVLDKNVK